MAEKLKAQSAGPSLTAEELAEVRADAQAEVAKEVRKAAMKTAMDLALREERIAAGLEKEAPEDIMVDVMLDLPENITPNACLTVDGIAYWHGTKYTVSLPKARSLIDMQQQSWRNLAREKGDWNDVARMRGGHGPRGIGTVGVMNAAASFR